MIFVLYGLDVVGGGVLLDALTKEEMMPEDLPFFRALSKSKQVDLLRNAVVHRVGSGTVLFEQGDVPTFQHVVLSGSAQLFGRSAAGGGANGRTR